MELLLGMLLGMIKEQIATTGGDGGKAVTWAQLESGITGLMIKLQEAGAIPAEDQPPIGDEPTLPGLLDDEA